MKLGIKNNKSKINRNKILVVVIVILAMISSSNITAVDLKLSNGNHIEKGQEYTVTLILDYPIAAYDSLEVTYDNTILTYVSGDPLEENIWYDDTDEQNGAISKKTYRFKGIKEGTTSISIQIKGLVRANETMDDVGDIYVSKNISVGKCGDINRDGKVNADDAAEVIEIFKTNAQTEQNKALGDVNNDNKVDAEDAAIIIEYFKTNK